MGKTKRDRGKDRTNKLGRSDGSTIKGELREIIEISAFEYVELLMQYKYNG